MYRNKTKYKLLTYWNKLQTFNNTNIIMDTERFKLNSLYKYINYTPGSNT